MSLRSTLGLSREGSLEEGTPDEVMEEKRRAYAERVRPARLEVARRNPKWTELEEVDLVRRGRDYLVSAETDLVYTLVRGVVFQPHTINVMADQAELAFYVERDGDLVFLERIPGTWSEFVERREKRKLERTGR